MSIKINVHETVSMGVPPLFKPLCKSIIKFFRESCFSGTLGAIFFICCMFTFAPSSCQNLSDSFWIIFDWEWTFAELFWTLNLPLISEIYLSMDLFNYECCGKKIGYWISGLNWSSVSMKSKPWFGTYLNSFDNSHFLYLLLQILSFHLFLVNSAEIVK